MVASGSGLIIADDADDVVADPWSRSSKASGMLIDGDDDDAGQPVVEHRSTAAFRPVASTSKAPPPPSTTEDDIPADEAPMVVGGIVEEAPTAASTSSAFTAKRLKGGLQTSSQLKEENARRRAAAEAEREAARALKQASESQGGGEETVYRDASGKKIDTKAAKAELARAKRKEMEKEMAKMEWGKGLVQREGKEKRQREIDDMANRPFARHRDDEEINDELKEVQRWNDPAARFLSDKKDKTKKKGPTRPKYSGPPPPPNRFNILPGYRWDGVDRSNGFERELVQAANRRKVKDAAARVYSTEDM
ncbi:hypothetical protein P389DRAFT_177920 [Cystobasidium minutum MCA 4210]|uniref:uncharacterized protein n=1 Tax=Cystobasidium minutum MCA 4210 TaxID=1397322 RepID=UPI0034CFFB11|eukprot:jgi/Rhomi1/177920/fgenesh1_pg.2_\